MVNMLRPSITADAPELHNWGTVTICIHKNTCKIIGLEKDLLPGGGGHSHQLPYGGVPLYRVDFESVILSNFPKIGCDFIKFP